MKRSNSLFLALAVFLLGPSVAHGQRVGRFASVSPSTRYASSSGRIAPIRTVRRSGFTREMFTSGLPFTNPYRGGMGFNGINAITAQNNLGVEAAIDPATQWNLVLAERLLRSSRGISSGGGYYLLSGGGTYLLPEDSIGSEQPIQNQDPPQGFRQPQVIVLQQASAPQTNVESPPAMAPLPDVGQFTLILQNGKQIQAVAFTHTIDRIIYITADGSRGTIALGDLDTNDTVRINQERGTPLQFPL